MAVSYVGVTSGNSAGGTSTSFVTTLPAGWAQDDVAILSGHVRGTSLTMSTPAGWTLVPGPTWPVNQSTNSRLYAWYRVLQAGDTAPTITNSGSMTGGWSMTAYRGADTTTPIGQVGTSSVSGTSLALPTLTGVLAGSALAVAVHAGVSTGTIPTNITPNAAYTEVADHATSRATTAANQRMEAAYRLIASAGTYGGESFTTDVTSSMIAVLVEVEQAATSASGSLAASLPPLTVSAAGSSRAAGTVGGTLPAIAAAAAGSVRASASLAGQLPSLVAQAAGTARAAGSFAGSLPTVSAVVAGSSAAPPAGPLAASAPALVAQVAGSATAAGTATAVLPALVGEFTGAVVSREVARPDGGVTPRPSAGTTVRPGSTVTARPASGSTVRPLTGVTERP